MYYTSALVQRIDSQTNSFSNRVTDISAVINPLQFNEVVDCGRREASGDCFAVQAGPLSD